MQDGDGTHRELEWEAFGTHVTKDGTFTRFVDQTPNWYHQPSYLGTVITSDGTKVEYGAGVLTSTFNNDKFYDAYPVKIMDRSGNYIKINYVGNTGPKIASIEDSLGRYVVFHYSAGDLISITVPGYAGGDDLQVARFYYQDLAINASFQNPGSGSSVPGTKRMLKYVFLPGTKAGWKYEYSSYGMIYRMKQLRAMVQSDIWATPGTPDTISNEGQIAATTTYDYPLVASNLNDIPQFTQRTDDWAGNTLGYAVPTYFSSNPSAGTTSSTDFNGVVTESKRILTGSFAGLIGETVIKNSGGTILSKSVQEYDPGMIWRNFRVSKVTSTISIGSGQSKSKITEYTYDSFNNITLSVEKDYDGNEVRRTETAYENGSGWISRRLLRLPKSVVVKNASGGIASRVDFVYDNSNTGVSGANLLARSNAYNCTNIYNYQVAYDPNACPEFWGYVNDPNDPDCNDLSCYQWDPYNCNGSCDQIAVYSSPYDPSTAYRGNVTKVKRWAKPAATEAASLENNETNYTYDIAGNLITETANCCNLKTYTYVKANEFTFPTQVSRGTGGQLVTSAVYDFNTGLVRETRDENNQLTTYDYYANSLRSYQSVRPDGGKSVNYYYDNLYAAPDAAHMNSYVATQVYDTASTYSTNYQYYNGIGQATRGMGHYYFSGTYRYAMSDTEYDYTGRPYRRNNPYYGVNGRLSAIPQTWSYTSYDDLGRVTNATAIDNSQVQISYDGDGGNSTIQTVTDQSGKQRRSLTDALGRLSEMQEPDPIGNGTIGTLALTQRTTYQYDILDNLISSNQAVNLNAGGTQTRYFKYDGLSRLTHERQVEQVATISQADALTTNGLWTKKIAYDLQGKITSTLDARGTTTSFSYDALNRISGITYSGGSPTVATPAVTYVYDEPEAGYLNYGRLTEVRTAALGAAPATKIQYDYDLMGQVKKHNQIVGANTYEMNYGYNLAGQLTSEKYPSTRMVNYNFQTGYGLTSVNDASNTYLSAMTYTPHGAVNSETLGNGAIHTMAFNDRLQLSQINLVKSGTELQRYDYSYGQYDATNTTLDATKNNGQIAKIEGFIGGAKQWEQRHSYDALGRLCVAGEYRGDNNLVSWRTHYGYDRYGNRYQSVVQNPNTGVGYVGVASGDVSLTTNRFAANVTYDNGGNITNDNKFKANVSYSYDANNRVISTNGGASTAVYDAAGQRVCSTEGGVTTTFVYNASGQLIAEYNGATPIREYIGNLATVESSTVRYLMSDHLGSNRVVMNAAGTVTTRHDYLPFGEELSATMGMRTAAQGYGASDPTRSKFAGMERETGLDHTLFRKAETKSGRWNSPDPYNGSVRLRDPQSLNRYHYVQNDPVNAVDPLGLAWKLISGNVCVGYTESGRIVQTCKWEQYWVWEEDKPVDQKKSGPPQVQPVRKNSNGGTNISPCAAAILAMFFTPARIQNMSIHEGSFVPSGMDAITFGNRVNFKKGKYNERTAAGIAAIGHEIVHAEQYEKEGLGGFLYKYVIKEGVPAYAKALSKNFVSTPVVPSGSPSAGVTANKGLLELGESIHDDLQTEKDAIDKENSMYKQIVAKYGSNPCP